MGQRIHKVLGYGLTDVATGDYAIVDPRINAESFLFGLGDARAELSYDQWLTGRYPDDFDAVLERRMLGTTGAESAYRTVTWEAEYGLPNVLVVSPADEPRWHRYDDPIDYEEVMIRGDEPYSVTRTIGGIHPYEGIYMDARTGERITGIQADRIRVWRRLVNAPLKEGVSEAEKATVLDQVAQRLEFDVRSHVEAERYIVPLVPDSIRRVCEWGELFTSPEVWRQLRPLVYTYHT